MEMPEVGPGMTRVGGGSVGRRMDGRVRVIPQPLPVPNKNIGYHFNYFITAQIDNYSTTCKNITQNRYPY
jgi:hypothetical protein